MSVWHFKGDLVQFTDADWSVAVDPKNPANGVLLSLRSIDSAIAPMATTAASGKFEPVLGIHPQPAHSFEIEEAYDRQDDLIIRYAETEKDQFSLQFNYRRLEVKQPFSLGLETWFSLQTTLLDSQPTLEISSKLPQPAWQFVSHQSLTGESRKPDSAPAAMVYSGNDHTLVWLSDPHDQVNVQLVDTSAAEQPTLRLFDHFMEKGVIRRARTRLLVSSAAVDNAHILDAYREFAASPLPLTA